MLKVLLFTICYVLLAMLKILSTGNLEFLFYIAVIAVLICVIGVVHYYVRLGVGLLWCLSFWGFLHMAGGLVAVPDTWLIQGDSYVLYNLWLIPHYFKYDQLVHIFGFGVTTLLCWQGLSSAFKRSLKPKFGLLVLCVAAGMGFGALNEVIEFIATLIFPETNVGGYVNTGWDLVSNLAGCTIAALLIRFRLTGFLENKKRRIGKVK